MSDFKNTAEIWQWLLDGGKVTKEYNNVAYGLKEGALFDYSSNTLINIYFNYPKDWSKYIEPKWYENIPEHGVLCWCGNNEDRLTIISVITQKGYNNGFYSSSNNHFCFATPLTNEEIKKYLLPD